MNTYEDARTYVASLRQTRQWRKSYSYGVCFKGGKVIGFIPWAKPSWTDALSIPDNADQLIIVKGKDA